MMPGWVRLTHEIADGRRRAESDDHRARCVREQTRSRLSLPVTPYASAGTAAASTGMEASAAPAFDASLIPPPPAVASVSRASGAMPFCAGAPCADESTPTFAAAASADADGAPDSVPAEAVPGTDASVDGVATVAGFTGAPPGGGPVATAPATPGVMCGRRVRLGAGDFRRHDGMEAMLPPQQMGCTRCRCNAIHMWIPTPCTPRCHHPHTRTGSAARAMALHRTMRRRHPGGASWDAGKHRRPRATRWRPEPCRQMA